MSEGYYRERLEAVKDERDALQASNDRLWARTLQLAARVAELETLCRGRFTTLGQVIKDGGRESGDSLSEPKASVEAPSHTDVAAANPTAPAPGVAEAEELARNSTAHNEDVHDAWGGMTFRERKPGAKA